MKEDLEMPMKRRSRRFEARSIMNSAACLGLLWLTMPMSAFAQAAKTPDA